MLCDLPLKHLIDINSAAAGRTAAELISVSFD